MKSNTKLSPLNLARMGLFTAIVAIVTMAFSIYVPATRGFFNVGDSVVFLGALLFGPIIGAFAGGVGSALADLLLGYPFYAPATLIIKGVEGFVVGWLYEKKPKISESNWKITTLLLGLGVCITLSYFGISYYSGNIELALGTQYFTIIIPELFWVILSTILLGFIIWLGWKHDPEIGWSILSTIIGGSFMVIGYFLYQYYLIGPLFQIEVVAIAELPINIGQMIVGVVVAIPLLRGVKRFLPFLSTTS